MIPAVPAAPMDAPCQLLPWDSAFFGFPIARVRGGTLNASRQGLIDAWCNDNGIRCLYLVAAPDDAETVTTAELRGYHLADVRLTFERPIQGPVPSIPLSIRPAKEHDIPTLQAIARAGHTDTRFFYDRNFSVARAHDLYEEWIRASFNGFAQKVLVADEGGGPEGYSTCHLLADGESGSLGLLAVAAGSQGKGFGKTLVHAAVSWLAERGAKRATVVTQGRNLTAQRLYGRCGFIPSQVQLYYHLWFDRGAR